MLNEVALPILSNEVANQVDWLGSNRGGDRVTPEMITAGTPEGGKDSCQVGFDSFYTSKCLFFMIH